MTTINDSRLDPAVAAELDQITAGRRIPRATYRLQFGPDLSFKQAAAIVPYLHDLGISDAYASPVLAACPGSTHGYDICDPSRLNPNLGGADDFAALVTALQHHEMGLILDMVPNHMGITPPHNAWWMEVLENGPAAPAADMFDIDWDPIKPEFKDKVMLPILEDQYGRVLEDGKLVLVYKAGAFFIYYGPVELPVNPRSYATIMTECLDDLVGTLDESNEHLLEYQSILTALGHLPPLTADAPALRVERSREKEIIKRRLAALAEASAEVRAAVEAGVEAFKGRPGEPASFDKLHALLEAQAYRLAFWRVAAEEINYRRFFDINDLAAIRVERPEVFRATHDLVLRLLAEGQATGLRIDHPDGLWNPARYFRRLQESYLAYSLETRLGQPPEGEMWEGAAAAWLDRRANGRPVWPLYVVAEKILSEREPLPPDWTVYGTTGYDFLNAVNGLFVERENAARFDNIYRRFSRMELDFEELVTRSKELMMRISLASEVNTLGHRLERIEEKNRRYRDFTLNGVTAAIREVMTSLEIYRTYIRPGEPVSARDERYLAAAVANARRRNPRLAGSLFDFVGDTLLLRNLPEFRPEDRADVLEFVMQFQQVSGPLMAKGVEDTAFYVYNRLVSLNEVGGSPDEFGLSLPAFHAQNTERLARWPHAMLATSTHDTKRSEDVRARLNVLSEMPDLWAAALARWRSFNDRFKSPVDGQPAPDRNDEILFYQTLIGVWPFAADGAEDLLLPPAAPAFTAVRDRIRVYMQKATNEAKIHTSWINPNKAYDAAIDGFIDRVMDPARAARFLGDVLNLARRVAYYGQFNSLAQLLLKLTAPGIPDVYQGTELWDLSLVDPDNRRPVDYELRQRLLAELRERTGTDRQELARDLLARGGDGRLKLYVIKTALEFRRDHAGLFAGGDYRPLVALGSKARHACVFSRSRRDETILVIVPRLVFGLTDGLLRPPVGPEVWADTRLKLPDTLAGRPYRELFTGQAIPVKGDELPLADILADFPVAILVG